MFTPITIQKAQEGLFSGNTHLTLLPRLVSTYSSGRGWDEISTVTVDNQHSRSGLRACQRPFCRFLSPLTGHSYRLDLGRFPRSLSIQLRRRFQRHYLYPAYLCTLLPVVQLLS